MSAWRRSAFTRNPDLRRKKSRPRRRRWQSRLSKNGTQADTIYVRCGNVILNIKGDGDSQGIGKTRAVPRMWQALILAQVCAHNEKCAVLPSSDSRCFRTLGAGARLRQCVTEVLHRLNIKSAYS